MNQQPQWDKKTIIGILLCVAFYLAYTTYLNKRYPGRDNKGEVAQTTEAGQTASTPATTQDASSPAPSAADSGQQQQSKPSEVVSANATSQTKTISDADLSVETDNVIFRFQQDIGGIRSIKLKEFKETKAPDSPFVELLESPLALQGTITPDQAKGSLGYEGERQGNTIRFWRTQDNWQISQEYDIPQHGYGADIRLRFTNLSDQPQELSAGLLLTESFYIKKSGGGFLSPAPTNHPMLFASVSGKTEFHDIYKSCESSDGFNKSFKNEFVDFFGFDKHYFSATFLPKDAKINLSMQKAALATTPKDICPMAVVASQAYGMIQPKAEVVISYQGYFGPKEVRTMSAYHDKLKETIDLGWFSFIAYPLLLAIKGFYKYTGNYGVAIIIMTLLLKVLFYPLTKAAAVSMNKMKKLQPEMNRIREKYKDDTRQQQQELMRFMAANKINPMKGCLPMLPQIPVFFAYWRMLSGAIELRHAEFFGWITDLSAADPYYISPLLMGVGMFVQQKLTPTTGMDKNQEKVMMFLPIMFTAMMLSLPSGLVIYMLTNTIVSIAQQQWLNRKLNK